MPRFLLLIYGDESGQASATEEQQAQEFQAYAQFDRAITAEGIKQGGEALQPTTTAKTVQVRDGETVISDGPFAETKEQLGGFYLVDVENEEQALAAAARIPTSRYGSIEVRPIWETAMG